MNKTAMIAELRQEIEREQNTVNEFLERAAVHRGIIKGYEAVISTLENE